MFDFGTFFTGGGGADTGIEWAGGRDLFGIEFSEKAAGLYSLNHHGEMFQSDILSIQAVPHIDFLWVSPPCPSFSKANKKKGETENDIALILHTCKLIKNCYPHAIAIENVPDYADSRCQSFKILMEFLKDEGYFTHWAIYNAANYGVPQTRRRLIVRASRSPLGPVTSTHSKNPDQLDLFGSLRPWISWDSAIKGLELQERPLTAAQQRSIALKQPRGCFAIERGCYRYGTPDIYPANQPIATITAARSSDHEYRWRYGYNLVLEGRSYVSDVACLAAWQSFPSSYNWGDRRAVAARAIGNAVPPLLAKAIALSFGL
jgi:site-specific DNA-cytosine methylase